MTIKERALAAGAVDAVVVDVREEFANDFVAPALKANAKYEGKYPLISSLSRPVIVKHLVATARASGADAIGHGCTGKGNDQVRFEVSTAALAPDLEVVAPVRRLGTDPRAVDRLRRRMGYPYHRHQVQPVQHRPEPLGPDDRVRNPGRPLGAATRGGLRADHARPPPPPPSWSSASSKGCRWPSTDDGCPFPL